MKGWRRSETEKAERALEQKEEKGECADPRLRMHFLDGKCETCSMRTTVYLCGATCKCLHHCYICAFDDGWSANDLSKAK